MYSLLLYKERDASPIQYTKNINGTASLVDAIRILQEKYNTPGRYRILFATCSCKVVNRKERKQLMINHRKKQYYKAKEPPEKKRFLEKKNLGIGKMNRKYRRNCPKNKKQWILLRNKTC